MDLRTSSASASPSTTLDEEDAYSCLPCTLKLVFPDREDIHAGLHYLRFLLIPVSLMAVSVIPISVIPQAFLLKSAINYSSSTWTCDVAITDLNLRMSALTVNGDRPAGWWVFWLIAIFYNKAAVYGAVAAAAYCLAVRKRPLLLALLIVLVAALCVMGLEIFRLMRSDSSECPYNMNLRHITYGLPSLLSILAVYIVSPPGSRCCTLCRIAALVMVAGLTYAILSEVGFQFAVRVTEWYGIMAGICLMRSTRSLGVFAYLALCDRIEGASDSFKSVLIFCLHTTTTVASHCLQISSSSTGYMALIVSTVLASLSEINSNYNHILGRTEVESWLDILQQFLRSCRLRCRPQGQRVSPDTLNTSRQSSVIAWQPADAAAWVSPEVHSRQTILTELVFLSNLVELCTLIMTAIWFGLVKSNVLSPLDVFGRTCIVLVAEIVTDFLTATFSNKANRMHGGRYFNISLVPRNSNSGILVRLACMLYGCLMCLAWLTKISSRLCPVLEAAEFVRLVPCVRDYSARDGPPGA